MRARLALFAAALTLLPSVSFARKDPYEEMAAKISDRAASNLTEKKIAVLPFDYIDGRKSQAGQAIAEELANRFVEYGKLRVIERSQIQKVLGEVKLASTGVIDESTAKQLRGLGVEAVVTGTLEDRRKGKEVAINVKAIRTDTLEVVAVAKSVVDKTWQDEAPQVAQQPGGEESQSYAKRQASEENTYRAPSLRSHKPHGFFDFFLGAGGGNMDLKFENTSAGENHNEFGFTSGTPDASRSYSWDSLAMKGAVPLGFRVGGFGEVLGGDFEMSFFSQAMKPQSTTFKINDSNAGSFTFGSDEYLKVNVFNLLSGDLLVRLPTGEDIFPYFGVGMGLTLTNIQSPFVTASATTGSSTLNDVKPGFMFRVPIGIRFRLAENFALFTEGRFVLNTVKFDRGFNGETDSLTLKGFQFLGGLGILF